MGILVADDERELLDITVKRLKAQGYAVDGCDNGDDAAYYLEQTPYDLAILDIMMPGMDGFETMAELRKFSRMAVGAARKDVTDVYGEPKKQDGGLLVYRASERAGEPALCFELEEDAVIAIFLATEQI